MDLFLVFSLICLMMTEFSKNFITTTGIIFVDVRIFFFFFLNFTDYKRRLGFLDKNLEIFSEAKSIFLLKDVFSLLKNGKIFPKE